MRTVPGLVLFLSALALRPAVSGAARPDCFDYGTPVSVSGTLKRLTFPGPPNYESVKRGDAAETGLYIALPQPVCANRKADDDPGHEARNAVRLIQLVLDARDFRRLASLVGKPVTARGAVFSSFTGHHHAPLLLEKAVVTETRQ